MKHYHVVSVFMLYVLLCTSITAEADVNIFKDLNHAIKKSDATIAKTFSQDNLKKAFAIPGQHLDRITIKNESNKNLSCRITWKNRNVPKNDSLPETISIEPGQSHEAQAPLLGYGLKTIMTGTFDAQGHWTKLGTQRAHKNSYFVLQNLYQKNNKEGFFIGITGYADADAYNKVVSK